VLDAELMVDAMGRGARTPTFLESLGYGRPVTERSAANASYSSQLLRVPAGTINGLFANERAAVVGGYPRWGFVSLS
jgi:hypothetical protein